MLDKTHCRRSSVYGTDGALTQEKTSHGSSRNCRHSRDPTNGPRRPTIHSRCLIHDKLKQNTGFLLWLKNFCLQHERETVKMAEVKGVVLGAACCTALLLAPRPHLRHNQSILLEGYTTGRRRWIVSGGVYITHCVSSEGITSRVKGRAGGGPVFTDTPREHLVDISLLA
ncbi:hypothetical protein J6590_070801 [Homalodisca vitripennis]|nr:hypothetical protein J6590_070801 [Homalodisca vitripennis]